MQAPLPIYTCEIKNPLYACALLNALEKRWTKSYSESRVHVLATITKSTLLKTQSVLSLLKGSGLYTPDRLAGLLLTAE